MPQRAIIGVSAYLHDAAAALITSDDRVYCIANERISGVKHDAALPVPAIREVCRQAGISLADVDQIAFNMKPAMALMGRVRGALCGFPRSLRLASSWQARSLKRIWFLRNELRKQVGADFERTRLQYVQHHVAHAASAFYTSGVSQSACLVLDGGGECDSGWMGYGDKNGLKCLRRFRGPASIGYFYSTITQFLGFNPHSDECKTMSLAAYGKPVFLDKLRKCLWKTVDSFGMRIRYFDYHLGGKTYYTDELCRLLGPPRLPGEAISDYHADVAASAQRLLEEVVLHLASVVCRETSCQDLCYAGGVALNSVCNGKILQEKRASTLHIPPAPGDDGGALGAALHTRIVRGNGRSRPAFYAACGSSLDGSGIERSLDQLGACYRRPDNIVDKVADELEEGGIVAWFQGRMEFGPRALGHRSLLADPRRPEMRQLLNDSIKKRLWCQPFAPSVKAEHSREYFDLPCESPFMLFVGKVHQSKLQDIPACVHVDGSARVQTVNRDVEPLYWRLLDAFQRRTGVPVLLNTSLNGKGQPIINSVEGVVRFLRDTGISGAAIGRYWVEGTRHAFGSAKGGISHSAEPSRCDLFAEEQ